MKKQMCSLVLMVALVFCLIPVPAYMEAKRGSTLPEGVTEIDLRTVLGSDAADVTWACMLNAETCIALRSLPDSEEEQDAHVYTELIVLDMRKVSILSRTQIREAYAYTIRGWEDGAYVLSGRPLKRAQDDRNYWTMDEGSPYLHISVSPDGTMKEERVAKSSQTVMQSGKTAVREAIDGSLYAVDMATGEEELLIQGIPHTLWSPDAPEEIRSDAAYEAYAKYVPSPEEVGYWMQNGELGFYSVREFRVYRTLDEDRFVYTVTRWEQEGGGYGIYDLRTRTDHRITALGEFFGQVGDTLFGEAISVDINTYETTTLPASVQEQLEAAARWMTHADVEFSISPDGRKLALTGMIARIIEEKSWWDHSGDESKFVYEHTVTITDIQTGELIRTYDIDNPLATESTVEFYDETHAMLFCAPKGESGSAFIYLLDIGE